MPQITCPHCNHKFSSTLGLTVCPMCSEPLRLSRRRAGGDPSPTRTLKHSTPAGGSSRERLTGLRQELSELQQAVKELEIKTNLMARTKKAALNGKIAALQKEIAELESEAA